MQTATLALLGDAKQDLTAVAFCWTACYKFLTISGTSVHLELIFDMVDAQGIKGTTRFGDFTV